MSIETEFRQVVRAHLDMLDDQIVPVLGQLIAHDYPPEVIAISFEVFCDGFRSGFPIRAFFMDQTNTEFFVMINGQAEYPSPVDPGLLEIDRVFAAGLQDEFWERSGETLDTYTVAGQEAIKWFHEKWTQAGGREFSLFATIALHDDPEEFNLKTGAWQPLYSDIEK